MNYRNYTDEDITNAVASSISRSQVCRKLGIKPVGGNHETINRHVKRLGLDTSHFLGPASNLGRKFKSFDGLTKPESIKKRLFKERGKQCECCKRYKWFDTPIMIELHHIDGNRHNNERTNLQLLCPNCHSMTDNWRNRKK